MKNHRRESWLEENIRIIFSILVVIAIAAGLYSYEQRTGDVNDKPIGFENKTECKMILEETSGQIRCVNN